MPSYRITTAEYPLVLERPLPSVPQKSTYFQMSYPLLVPQESEIEQYTLQHYNDRKRRNNKRKNNAYGKIVVKIIQKIQFICSFKKIKQLVLALTSLSDTALVLLL